MHAINLIIFQIIIYRSLNTQVIVFSGTSYTQLVIYFTLYDIIISVGCKNDTVTRIESSL